MSSISKRIIQIENIINKLKSDNRISGLTYYKGSPAQYKYYYYSLSGYYKGELFGIAFSKNSNLNERIKHYHNNKFKEEIETLINKLQDE